MIVEHSKLIQYWKIMCFADILLTDNLTDNFVTGNLTLVGAVNYKWDKINLTWQTREVICYVCIYQTYTYRIIYDFALLCKVCHYKEGIEESQR